MTQPHRIVGAWHLQAVGAPILHHGFLLHADGVVFGSILIARRHSAPFSFVNLLPSQHLCFSLIVDKWQNVATLDIAEIVTEDRKFGVKLCVVNQFMAQLPTNLQETIMAMHTKSSFQLTPEASRQMVHLYTSVQTSVRQDDIDPHPVEYPLSCDSDNPVVEAFIDTYLHPIQRQKQKYCRVKDDPAQERQSPADIQHSRSEVI